MKSSERGYFSTDTIAAVITAVGGPVVVVRMSGPKAVETLLLLANGTFPDRVSQLVNLKDPRGSLIDQALVCVYYGTRSYTGEDCVELSIHGSRPVVENLFETLSERGIRQALPGEFSFRAVRNGKLTLKQAQAVSDLIGSKSRQSAQFALERLEGIESLWLRPIRNELVDLATLAEAGIDFSDQDLDEVSLSRLQSKLKDPLNRLVDLAATYGRGRRLAQGLSISFLGLPNAGKSSLFNVLLGEERSIVSEIAGTTRDIVREEVILPTRFGQVSARVQDTAGVRESHDFVEVAGVERSLKAAEYSDLVVLVCDVRELLDSKVSPGLEELTHQLKNRNEQLVVVCTQIDRLKEVTAEMTNRANRLFSQKNIYWVSSKTGLGVRELAVGLGNLAEKLISRDPGEVLLTREEDLRAVQSAILHLERGINSAHIDLLAADIRQALEALSPLIGEVLPDDILGKIFSTFCIGK
jgi:tRNA modification GTPase